MFSRIIKDLESGINKIRWFSSLLSERVRIEVAVFRLLYKSEELKKQKDELLKQIGEDVYAMRGKDKNVYSNREIAEAIKELEGLEPEIKENLERASEISRIIP